MNYEYFDSILENKVSKKLRYETWVRRDGDIIYIQHFDTPILQFFKNGKVIYSTGGWKTKTTKDRLNAYGPLNIYANSGLWWVGDFKNPIGVYKDGMAYHNGKLYNTATKNEINKYNALKKESMEYMKNFIQAAFNGEVAVDTHADCLYCQMGRFEPQETSHVISHIEEGYFVTSMLYHGLKITGTGPFLCSIVRDALVGTIHENYKDIAKTTMKSALSKIINRALLATL